MTCSACQVRILKSPLYSGFVLYSTVHVLRRWLLRMCVRITTQRARGLRHKFSKVFSIVPLYSTYTGALTFENVCQWVSHFIIGIITCFMLWTFSTKLVTEFREMARGGFVDYWVNFSKVLSIVPLYWKCARVLTFWEILDGWWSATSWKCRQLCHVFLLRFRYCYSIGCVFFRRIRVRDECRCILKCQLLIVFYIKSLWRGILRMYGFVVNAVTLERTFENERFCGVHRWMGYGFGFLGDVSGVVLFSLLFAGTEINGATSDHVLGNVVEGTNFQMYSRLYIVHIVGCWLLRMFARILWDTWWPTCRSCSALHTPWTFLFPANTRQKILKSNLDSDFL